jgi:hypothetical protein
MSTESHRPSIQVGNITNAQGVAVGEHVTATVTGSTINSGAVDLGQLRTALESLYDGVATAGLPKDKARGAQTAAGNAIEAAAEKDGKLDAVAGSVKKVADMMKEANMVVNEGSTMWNSVKTVAPLLGPVVGGAHIVASWFGMTL